MIINMIIKALFPTTSDTYRLAAAIKDTLRSLSDEGVLTRPLIVLIAVNLCYERYRANPIAIRRRLVAAFTHASAHQPITEPINP